MTTIIEDMTIPMFLLSEAKKLKTWIVIETKDEKIHLKENMTANELTHYFKIVKQENPEAKIGLRRMN